MTSVDRLTSSSTARVVGLVLPILVALLDSWLITPDLTGQQIAYCVVGALGLLLRTRWPLVAAVLALPSAISGTSLLIPAIAVFSVCRRYAEWWVTALASVVFTVILFLAQILPEPDDDWRGKLSTLLFVALIAAAPAVLGRLMLLADQLRQRVSEILRMQSDEEALRVQAAISHDRAELAREMHDVVSHQVSLIAIRAGALAVTSRDDDVVTAADDIRRLSTTTLDELRHMVTVLRASGTRESLAPQPTTDRITDLIDDSGAVVSVSGDIPDGLPSAMQRAIFRTVQEGLTNAHKHAPGSPVAVAFDHDRTSVSVVVTTEQASAADLELPGSGHGLRGLTERATLLGGSLVYGSTPSGGFRLTLTLPIT